jgi:hypothetical protein
MSGVLPSLGRAGIVNSVRKLSGYDVPGWRNVDPATYFIAGQVATLATSSITGLPVLDTISANTQKPIGIFFCNKALSFYQVVSHEPITMCAIGSSFLLAHANIKTGSFKLVLTSTGSAYTGSGTNYTLTETNGSVANVNITAGLAVNASYLYEDNTISGVDDTLGSGLASYLSDPCEIATLIYDTVSATAYTLGCPIYSTTTGYLTASTPGGSAYTVGTCTKIPTNSDPELWVRVRIS